MKTQLQTKRMRVAATRISDRSQTGDLLSLLRVGMLGFLMTWTWQANAQPVHFIPDPALKGTSPLFVSPVIINGTVRSAEDNQPIPGVSIYLKTNTAIGTVSDKDGAFEFPRPVNLGEVLLFSSIGFKTLEYEVTGQTTGMLDIHLEMTSILIGGEAAVDGIYSERNNRVQRLWSKVKGLF